MDVSVEIFPPKSANQAQSLTTELDAMAAFRPLFVSVTCGAGGTTQERTHALVAELHRAGRMEVAAHLTCVRRRQIEVDAEALDYLALGVQHIVALRGDPPEGSTSRDIPADGYAYAADLVAGLARLGPFDISVAAYPEPHPESTSAEADLDNLKRKVDAGASRAITQFCFDTDTVFRFIDRARAAGIGVPIHIGVLPILDFDRAVAFASTCGASVPDALKARFAAAGSEPASRRAVALDVAREQCAALDRGGVDGVHFYTLNRAAMSLEICRSLGWTVPCQARAAEGRPHLSDR
ncbi:MAG: methylenetetrahydrofolate reductase [Rhodospirillaceae bacterium]|nr:methylenetetrahydrofolate reductase [Rhodospirillaceae bacterium]MCA8932167.1 methylenetetrahydrofolate reductase [Rhodospirillaceae bacterium]